MKTLHLTNQFFNYNQKNPKSILISSVDDDFSHNEYHTSIGDLQMDQIISIAHHFDYIDMCDDQFDQTSDVYYDTVFLHQRISKNSSVNQLPITFTDNINISARTNDPVLWVFGCSHSYGVGLRPGESRYGEIVARQLQLPLKSIVKPGSSLHWSTRHLINANIQPGDTIIWQLTTPPRVSVFDGNEVKEILLANSNDRHLVIGISMEQLYFTQLSLLNFGVRYLRACGAKFVLTSLNADSNYTAEYNKYPEYCYSDGIFVDYGTDQKHLGPKGHQLLATRLLDHIRTGSNPVIGVTKTNAE